MNAMRFWSVCAVLATAAIVAGPARSALADDFKIGVVDPIKVFGDCAEGKELKTALKANDEGYKQALTEKQNKLKAMQDDLKLSPPDSPAYSDKNRALLNATIEFNVWQKLQEMDMNRKRNMGVKKLYDEIQTATAQVAQQKGLSLVLADKKFDKFPDDLGNVDPNQLEGALLQRNILYTDAKVDITQDVTSAMDKAYAEKK